MTARLFRLALLVAAPLLLASCVLAPGKFVSTLSINADRSFTFTYSGEVYAIDMSKSLDDSLKGDDDSDDNAAPGDNDNSNGDDTATPSPAGYQADSAPDSQADTDAKNRAIAAALAREAGYRKVEYVGNNKFIIDYSITSKLTHSFVYPYNVDAEAVFPFLVIEVRKDGTVRMQAPGFANDNSDSTGATGDAAKVASHLDGTFTLDTDAEIVSQNSETGAKPVNGRKTIGWKATPLTRTAPMAVLRLQPLG